MVPVILLIGAVLVGAIFGPKYPHAMQTAVFKPNNLELYTIPKQAAPPYVEMEKVDSK